jgi:hypothetical protein
MNSYANILAIYEGSDGEATKLLYLKLQALGPVGEIAVNLFRAQKCSARAKLYRRRDHKGEAYDRKNWALNNLCTAMIDFSLVTGLRWGWKIDPAQEFHQWVLYVELPTGQVSFHSAVRGKGPDYDAEWDGVRDICPQRVVAFVHCLLSGETPQVVMRLGQAPDLTKMRRPMVFQELPMM